jgi:hypothetical protein
MSPTHIVMNKAMQRRLTQAARDTTVGGFITYDKDAFGRRVAVYNDLPILVEEDDTEFLPFTEAATSGTATATSIYVVSFTEGMLTGIQNGTMRVKDLGELQSKPVYRTRVEWFAGISLMHGRSASRLWSISDAPVTV